MMGTLALCVLIVHACSHWLMEGSATAQGHTGNQIYVFIGCFPSCYASECLLVTIFFNTNQKSANGYCREILPTEGREEQCS